MQIHHIAIWTHNLETLKSFYETYFNARAGEKYINAKTGFESYFLSLDGGPRIEIMQKPGIPLSRNDPLEQFTGLIHFAISVGSVEAVDELTKTLAQDLYTIASPARWTGDGYYESVILDPDGNRVEITI